MASPAPDEPDRVDHHAATRRALPPSSSIRPPGFHPARLETWPQVEGRLEWVEGRLLYMPPCGDLQQGTVTDMIITLGARVRAHQEFVLGTNEAGMRLGRTRALPTRPSGGAPIWAPTRRASARCRRTRACPASHRRSTTSSSRSRGPTEC
jgi:hypothetical protein